MAWCHQAQSFLNQCSLPINEVLWHFPESDFPLGAQATILCSEFNTLRPRQNGRHFPDHTLNRIFVNENIRISIEFSLKFVPKGPINNIPSLVRIMAWRRPGDKPLSEPVMVSLLTHICVTWPQWVKSYNFKIAAPLPMFYHFHHGTLYNSMLQLIIF